MSIERVKHTPTPWFAKGMRLFKTVPHTFADGRAGTYDKTIAQTFGSRENAEFIERAVNNHYEMMKALREARGMLRSCTLDEPDEDYQRSWDAGLALIDAAIAKAEQS